MYQSCLNDIRACNYHFKYIRWYVISENIFQLNVAMGVGFIGIENHQEK